MPDMVLNREGESSWIRYIKGRITQNKNFLCFISGQTGSGKSYSSLRIAEELDSEFNIDRIVFSGTELMDLINSGTLRKGSVIVFEEAGIGLSHRSWQSITNKMLNFLMQTFRHRNFILIFNSPYMDFIDASTRKLFHAEIQTIAIDFKSKKCKLKPQLIQYNQRIQKFYFKYLRVITKDGVMPVVSWRVDKPSKDLLVKYEEKKTAFTTKLNQSIRDELERVENSGMNGKELTQIQQDTLELLKKGKTIKEIAQLRGRSKYVIHASVKLIKQKGYQLNPIKDGYRVTYQVQEPDSEKNRDIQSNTNANQLNLDKGEVSNG